MSALMMCRSDNGWGMIAFQMDTDIIEYKPRQKYRDRKEEKRERERFNGGKTEAQDKYFDLEVIL
jgi:hypothetical protein